jgi:hypothetical protein
VLTHRGFCFSAFSVFQFSAPLHGIHLSRRRFLRHLPGAPKSVQHEAADGGLPPTGCHAYLFRFLHGTSQKYRASGSRRTEGCARRCLIEFTKSRKPREQHFFHVQSRSQPRQDVGADGSPIALGAVANCGGFVCGTADQEGGSIAHGAMISSDIILLQRHHSGRYPSWRTFFINRGGGFGRPPRGAIAMSPSNDELLSFLSENADWWEQTGNLFEEIGKNPRGTPDASHRATWNLLSAVQRERAQLCRSFLERLRGNSARPSAMTKETAV